MRPAPGVTMWWNLGGSTQDTMWMVQRIETEPMAMTKVLGSIQRAGELDGVIHDGEVFCRAL